MQSQRVAQACDACKLRKVKCSGTARCAQCTHLDLQCVYAACKQLRRPPRRGRIIQQYRESTVHPTYTATSTSPPTVHPTASSPTSATSPKSPGVSRIHGEYTQQFFLDLIPTFLKSCLPFHPLTDEAELREAISNMHNSTEDYAFVHAFGALVMNHESGPNAYHHVSSLSSIAIESRQCPTIEHFPFSVRRTVASIWIQNTMHTFTKFDLAFYYIREAISTIFILRLDDPGVLARLPLRERARRQRLYWETFIHERYLGIMQYQPVVLKPLNTLPDYDPHLPPGVHFGFSKIIRIFMLIDNDFVDNWQQFRTNSEGVAIDAQWFEMKHRQLDAEFHDDEGAETEQGMLSDMQRADITVTRQWLRTLLWQMAMSKCLLSSSANPAAEHMSLLFPVKLSQQLRDLLLKMSRDAIRVNGYGILQKMFEVTDAIADVIIHVPAASDGEARVRVDHFLYLYRLLVTFPRFVTTQKRILTEKCRVIEDMYPDLAQ